MTTPVKANAREKIGVTHITTRLCVFKRSPNYYVHVAIIILL